MVSHQGWGRGVGVGRMLITMLSDLVPRFATFMHNMRGSAHQSWGSQDSHCVCWDFELRNWLGFTWLKPHKLHLLGPRTLHKVWIEDLVPAVLTLHVRAVGEATSDQFPVVIVRTLNQVLQLFVLSTTKKWGLQLSYLLLLYKRHIMLHIMLHCHLQCYDPHIYRAAVETWHRAWTVASECNIMHTI